nr:hypothetical protein [Micromonospora sp. DSM 115978]
LIVIKDYVFQSDFARRHIAEGEARAKAEGEARGKAEGEARGKAEGEARAVLAVLEARGVDVPDGVRQDIASCTDLNQLDVWIRRAGTATTIEDLLGPAPTPGAPGQALGSQR